MEKKILRRSCRDSNPRPFNHESGALTTELFPPLHFVSSPLSTVSDMWNEQWSRLFLVVWWIVFPYSDIAVKYKLLYGYCCVEEWHQGRRSFLLEFKSDRTPTKRAHKALADTQGPQARRRDRWKGRQRAHMSCCWLHVVSLSIFLRDK